MSEKVSIVFDVESEDAPWPLGVYLHTMEGAVLYETPDKVHRWAPEDCVKVVSVEV